MNTLTEKMFDGTWRSYKTFLRSGNVKLYTLESFLEFDFGKDRLLTVNQYDGYKAKKLVQTTNWEVKFSNRSNFLYIENSSPSYEVITVNHTALVLLDLQMLDKIFFAKLAYWEALIKNNTELVF